MQLKAKPTHQFRELILPNQMSKRAPKAAVFHRLLLQIGVNI